MFDSYHLTRHRFDRLARSYWKVLHNENYLCDLNKKGINRPLDNEFGRCALLEITVKGVKLHSLNDNKPHFLRKNFEPQNNSWFNLMSKPNSSIENCKTNSQIKLIQKWNTRVTPLSAANFNLVIWSGQSRMPWESIKYKLSRRLTWTGIETLFYSENKF